MAQPAVMLMISAQYGANTLEVTRNLDSALAELQLALDKEDIHLDSRIFRPARFIGTALHNLRASLIVGGILVIAVLFLFLFNFRTAAISCTAIPLSLLAATIRFVPIWRRRGTPSPATPSTAPRTLRPTPTWRPSTSTPPPSVSAIRFPVRRF